MFTYRTIGLVTQTEMFGQKPNVVRIFNGCIICREVQLGDAVVLHSGAICGASYIGDRSIIRSGAMLGMNSVFGRNCVVGNDVHIPANFIGRNGVNYRRSPSVAWKTEKEVMYRVSPCHIQIGMEVCPIKGNVWPQIVEDFIRETEGECTFV